MQSKQIGIRILDKAQVIPFNDREFKTPWLKSANAAFQLNHSYATLYIEQSIFFNVGNGWDCREPNYRLRGWHFSDVFQDSPGESISYKHLITFPKDVALIYFLRLDFIPGDHYYMFEVGQAIRDYIEIHG